jgi:hypothetical protein
MGVATKDLNTKKTEQKRFFSRDGLSAGNTFLSLSLSLSPLSLSLSVIIVISQKV